mmetsp:Transcript_21899/g.33246  ORF Transcript_21899/g.33246 Transcript_21899/m.33246 type:complete len:94 (-) Transcript_21899:592-873(-)
MANHPKEPKSDTNSTRSKNALNPAGYHSVTVHSLEIMLLPLILFIACGDGIHNSIVTEYSHFDAHPKIIDLNQLDLIHRIVVCNPGSEEDVCN